MTTIDTGTAPVRPFTELAKEDVAPASKEARTNNVTRNYT